MKYKTIYEYHRVTFQQHEIINNTIIKLTAQPTCLGYSDCNACINHNTTFTVSTELSTPARDGFTS